MTLQELVLEFERRRAEAAQHGATAPIAAVYAIVLEELRRLDGTESVVRWMSTREAAAVLAVHTRTVARWCKDGRFPGATKTSDLTGRWRIPAGEVYNQAGDHKKATPRLWEAE